MAEKGRISGGQMAIAAIRFDPRDHRGDHPLSGRQMGKTGHVADSRAGGRLRDGRFHHRLFSPPQVPRGDGDPVLSPDSWLVRQGNRC